MHKAELYQQSNAIQKRDAIACLEKRLPKMKGEKKNSRIIDIGCGDGSVTNILKKYLPSGFALIGADISEDMVRFATENHFDDQTSFIVLDIAGDLPEALKSNFDHVFSNYSIHWAIDQKQAFKNIFNLLDQNGDCFMIILAHHPVFEVYRTLSRNSKWSTWIYDIDNFISPYHDLQEPDIEIKKIMEDTGFVNIDVECEDKVFLYDIDILKKHAIAINACPIPKNKYDEFLDDYIRVLKDIEMKHTKVNYENFAKGITVHYKLVTVYGSKPSNTEMM